MARKSKLDQILETYTEEEIREICAASSSRTDFAKKLGIGHKQQCEIVRTLVDIFNLDIAHFIAARQQIPSKEELELACKNATSYKEMAELLNLHYKNDDILHAGIYKIIRKHNLDNSHFRGAANQARTSRTSPRTIPMLSLEEIEQYRLKATSYQNLAELCGCLGSAKQLYKQGKQIAEKYGLDKTDFAINRKRKHLQDTYATNMRISSWIWHHQNTKCSQCGYHIDNVGFLSVDIQQITLGEIEEFLICPSCHQKIKQQAIDETLLQLIPITQENIEKCGIYLIRNMKNGLLYVGKTSDSFYNRLNKHISNARNEKPGQKLETVMSEYGEKNFEFYILEIIDKDKSQKYFFKREDYWMDFLGTKNPLIGYNDYRSPSNHKFLTNEEIQRFLRELKESSKDLYELSLDYGISPSNAGRIRSGQTRKQPGFDYPIYSKKETDLLEKLLTIIQLLKNDELSFKEISQQCSISCGALRKYNSGKLPQWAWKMAEAELLQLEFPLRSTTPKVKYLQTKYVKQRFIAATGKSASKLAEIDADDLFNQVLVSSYKSVGRKYGLSDQAVRKFLQRRGYPSTLESIIVWLDEHPDVYSNKRVPLKSELYTILNELGKQGAVEYYGVSRKTIERWADYRGIKINHATLKTIYLEELDREAFTHTEVANILIEEGICQGDPRRLSQSISAAIKRYGCYRGIHMRYVEKPTAEYK